MEEAEPALLDEDQDKILYDLLQCYEWPETTTVIPSEGALLWRSLAAIAKACVRFAVDKIHYPLKFFRRGPSLAFLALLEAKLPWKLSITSNGTLLAVLKEDHLEIRSLLDNFESCTAEFPVAKDPLPKWRHLIWNEEGSLVAVGHSSGAVEVFMPSGKCVCTLPRRLPDEDIDESSLRQSIVGVTFIPPHNYQDDSVVCLLCVLFFNGIIKTYEIRVQSPAIHLHSFTLSDYYPSGVSAMVYHNTLSMLIVASCHQEVKVGDSVSCVSGWRLLDGAPYWTSRVGQQMEKKQKGLLSGVLSLGHSSSLSNDKMIFAMSVSPSGTQLISVDVSGGLCLWELPSFKMKRRWRADELPSTLQNMSGVVVVSSDTKKQGGSLLLDVSWWSEEALIIANTSGEVGLFSLNSLQPLLNNSLEEVVQGSSITPAYSEQFFVLNCESRSSSVMGIYHIPSLSEDSDEPEGEEGRAVSLTTTTKTLLKQVLYFFTEMERFHPTKKKPKFLTQKYRLSCLRSVPPEECYERKMHNGEYTEALALAQQYGLDCDLVYQTQWLNCPVSPSSIEQYMAKVTKRSWVLHECVNRVPEEASACKELLHYGLRRTNFRELVDASIDDDSYDGEDGESSRELDSITSFKSENETINEITEKLSHWKRLNADQLSLCQHRHLLLVYLDRLLTYEMILGGPDAAEMLFNWKHYENFRSTNLVEIALSYARESDWKALEVLFTYHGAILLPHKLVILSNIPETTHPHTYENLLPSLSSDGGRVEAWRQCSHREEDWVETEELRSKCPLPDEHHSNDGSFLYKESPEWTLFMNPTTSDVLTSWYSERAEEIEECSGQVDCSLELVEVGIKNNVTGLEVLQHQLQTLYTLVYQCDTDSRINLNRLRSMSNLDIIHLMMKDVQGAGGFISRFIQRVIPFLSRLETLGLAKNSPLLTEYLTAVSRDDLRPCLSIVEQSCRKGPESAHSPILTPELELTALKCVYVSKSEEQLPLVHQIVNCLPPTASSQLNALKGHLSAADILHRHEVYQSLVSIRDMQNNKEKAEKLLDKLTRVPTRKDPEMKKEEWQVLLDDILHLQSTVFSCVDKSTCYQIFAGNLLRSEKIENIHLASSLLTLSSSQPRQPNSRDITMMSFGYQLPYDTSVKLVVGAAREHFNSAKNAFEDNVMDLARECLELFPSPGPEVQSELNLIASLSILDDFSVHMIPVEVRLCENKLDIIRRVLESSAAAYKEHEMILRLAHFLGLDESDLDDEEYLESAPAISTATMTAGRGHTLIFIILTAIEKRDFKLAVELTKRLMSAQFVPAWEVCRKLGLESNIGDLQVRRSLLDFSLTHCPPEDITDILEERQALEVQTLYLKCTNQSRARVPQLREGSLERESVSMTTAGVQSLVGRSVQRIVSSGAGAVQRITKRYNKPETGGALFSGKSPNDVVRICAERIRELSKEVSSRQEEEEDTNEDRAGIKVIYHPFYSSNSTDSESAVKERESFSYSMFESGGVQNLPGVAVTTVALLRALLVGNEKFCKGEEKMDCCKELLQLARLTSERDLHLTLGYLLATIKMNKVDKLLSNFAPSKFSLQLAIYYFCLQVYSMATASLEPHLKPHPFLHPPVDLVEHVTKYVSSMEETDWSAEMYPLVELLRKYQEYLLDHTQARLLLGLGLGIDVSQFTQDSEYRHSIILSLARSSDAKVFSTALSLAQHHNIEKWEVHMSLVDSLLTVSSLSVHDVRKKMEEFGVVKVLLNVPQKTADCLRESVYPKLPGTKYSILLIYYSLLQQCVGKGAVVEESVGIDTHIKLLNKLQPAISGVDYKRLMSAKEDPLVILSPSLLSTNVHVVAKLANKIPCEGSQRLSSGLVFCAFALKLFWKGESKRDQPPLSSPSQSLSSTSTDWLHRYDNCVEYLSRLNPDELDKFVHNIALSVKATQELKVSVRSALLSRALETCQKLLTREDSAHKHQSHTHSKLTFEHLTQQLESNQKHLANVSSEELHACGEEVDKKEWNCVVSEFDLSLSQPAKVHSLVLKMVSQGLPLKAVNTILTLASSVHQHSYSTVNIVKEALSSYIVLLKPSESDQYKDAVFKIENILSTVSKHETNSGSLVCSSDVMDVLRPYCSDGSRPAESRRALLNLVNKYLKLSDEDTRLLLLYQTQSVLLDQLGVTEVSLEDMSSLDSQRHLFTSLLAKADMSDNSQILSLTALLDAWSQSTPPGSHVQSWVKLLEGVACHATSINHVVIIRAGLDGIPVEVDRKLFESVCAISCVDGLKFALVCGDSELTERGFEALKKADSVVTVNDVDLYELLIINNHVMSARSSSSSLYSSLLSYVKTPTLARTSATSSLFTRLLHCSELELNEALHLEDPAKRVMLVAKQLRDNGLIMEAGSLVLSAQQFHPTVMSLNSAVAFIGKLFSN